MRVPVSIITGFLGAGKTTLLRRLLAGPHGARTGVILNEIGEAGIDTGFELDSAFVELKDRCACCVQSADLQAAVEQVLSRPIARVLLETTGLADPLPIVWRLQSAELAPRLRVEAVITVLDPTAPEAQTSDEWLAQVRTADILTMAKRDVASDAAVAATLARARAINPSARLLEVGELPTLLLPESGEESDDPAAVAPSGAALTGSTSSGSEFSGRARHSDFAGTTITSSAVFGLTALEDWLDALPSAVFRAKGIVKTKDGFVGFHRVADRLTVDLSAPPPRHGETRVALFGRALDAQALRTSFLGLAS